MTPRRIHVTGRQGSGKSTLARRLQGITGAPLHGLDLIAREGGGNGPIRATDVRDRDVAAIAAGDQWITEGLHLGWTDPLLARADVIVWLDHLTLAATSGRMVRRFLAGGLHEMRTRRGRERFARLGDYLRHTRELGGAIRDGRAPDGPDVSEAVEAALDPWSTKVLRCLQESEVDAFVRDLELGRSAP